MFHDVPDVLGPQLKIDVSSKIAEGPQLSPRNLGVSLTDIFRDVSRGLTDDDQLKHDRREQLFVLGQ